MEFLNTDLEWDDFYWTGSFGGPLFDSIPSDHIRLQVGARDEEEVPPHGLQIRAWEALLEKSRDYSELILSGLFSHYTRIRPKYLQAGGDWAENMPVLAKSDEIAGLIRLRVVDIAWPHDGTVEVGLSFACNWDPEHGAGIVLRGLSIVDVGGADCLYASR